MFKQQAVTKLPTFLQFMKEHDLKEEDFQCRVTKILWGDAWKCITFQTEEFRYSVKFNSEEEYAEGCRQVLDAFQPDALMSAWVIYHANSGEVEIDWVLSQSEDNASARVFKQWDWGLVADDYAKPKPRSSSKKKPSAKLTTPAKEEQPPF